MPYSKHVDTASFLVIAVTFVLFLAAPLVKGFTHDLLLEAGIFLVSVKLIILGYKNGVMAEGIERQLAEIKGLLASGEQDPQTGA